jgi:hypothetical protein
MSKFIEMLDARRARSAMIREAMREYENSCRERYESPYPAMAGVLESMLTVLASDRLDSTEDVIRQLKNLSKVKEIA